MLSDRTVSLGFRLRPRVLSPRRRVRDFEASSFDFRASSSDFEASIDKFLALESVSNVSR